MPSADRRGRFLVRLADGVDRLSVALGRTVGFAAIVGSVGLMFYEVCSRYLFNHPTQFTIEYGLVLQIVVVAAAAAYVLRQGGHVEIELITERLSPRARDWFGVFQSVCGIAVCTILGIQIWRSAAWSLHIHKLTLDMEQPVAPFQFALFAGFVLLGLQFAARGLRFWWAARGFAPEPAHAHHDETGP